MGPYGSVWAHIKTARSPMAQDHFQTPPDPKKGYKNLKNPITVRKSVPNQPSNGCLLDLLGFNISEFSWFQDFLISRRRRRRLQGPSANATRDPIHRKEPLLQPCLICLIAIVPILTFQIMETFSVTNNQK